MTKNVINPALWPNDGSVLSSEAVDGSIEQYMLLLARQANLLQVHKDIDFPDALLAVCLAWVGTVYDVEKNKGVDIRPHITRYISGIRGYIWMQRNVLEAELTPELYVGFTYLRATPVFSRLLGTKAMKVGATLTLEAVTAYKTSYITPALPYVAVYRDFGITSATEHITVNTTRMLNVFDAISQLLGEVFAIPVSN